jgi:hypothetical protein
MENKKSKLYNIDMSDLVGTKNATRFGITNNTLKLARTKRIGGKSVKYLQSDEKNFVNRVFLTKNPTLKAFRDHFLSFGDAFDENAKLARIGLISKDLKKRGKFTTKDIKKHKDIKSIPASKFRTMKTLEDYLKTGLSNIPGSENLDTNKWEILPRIDILYQKPENVAGGTIPYPLFKTTSIDNDGFCFDSCLSKFKFKPLGKENPTIDEIVKHANQYDITIIKNAFKLKSGVSTKMSDIFKRDIKEVEIKVKDVRKSEVYTFNETDLELEYITTNKTSTNRLLIGYDTKRCVYHCEPIEQLDLVFTDGSFYVNTGKYYENLSLNKADDTEQKKKERREVNPRKQVDERNVYIFFDLETIINLLADKSPFVPYSMSALFLDDLEMHKLNEKDTKKINVDKIRKELKDKKKLKFYKGHDCVKNFLEELKFGDKSHDGNINYKLVSFNGSNFDNWFIVQELLENDLFNSHDFTPKSIKYFNGSILNFEFFNKVDTFDLGKHLTGSLDYNCKSFKVQSLTKSTLNHYDIQDLYMNNKKAFFNNTAIFEKIEKYNDLDVLSLAILFYKYRTIIKEIEFFPKNLEGLVKDNEKRTIKDVGINFWEHKTAGSLMYKVLASWWEITKFKPPEFVHDIINLIKGNKKSLTKCLEKLKDLGINHDINTYDELMRFVLEKEYMEIIECEEKGKTTHITIQVSYKNFYFDMLKYMSAGRCDLSENKSRFIKGQLYSLDVKSMYPFQMIINKVYFPAGKMIPSKYIKGDDRFGFFYCDIDQSNLPLNKKIQCEKVFDKRGNLVENNWCPKDKLTDYFLNTERIDYLIKHGCKVDIKDKDGVYFTEKIKNYNLFFPLISLMKIKNHQDKIKKTKEYNGALRETVKLLSNCVSGKVIEKLHRDTTAFVGIKDLKVKEIEDKDKFNIINMYDAENILVKYEKTVDEVFKRQQRPIFYGIFIYTYSQHYLYDYLYDYNVIYADTDSGKFTKEDGERWIKDHKKKKIPHWDAVEEYEPRYKDSCIYDSGIYGCFEDELKGFEVLGGYFSKKKENMIITKDPNYCKITLKGLKVRYEKQEDGSMKLVQNDIRITKKQKDTWKKMEDSPEKREMLYKYYEENKYKINDWGDIFNDLVKGKEVYFMTSQFAKSIGNTKKAKTLDDENNFNSYSKGIYYRNLLKVLNPEKKEKKTKK